MTDAEPRPMHNLNSSVRAPLKVCYIVATTEGAIWVSEQLQELRDRHGCEVCAILNGDRGSLVERLRSAGVPIHVCEFDFTSNADLFGLPHKVVALVRLLRCEKFDVVQTHLFHSMVIGRIAAWFADVPVRFSMVAGPFHLEAYTPRWIDRITCWTDTAIIASSEYTRTLYRQMGVPQERLALIYYGPDETKFDPATVAPADLHKEFGWAPDTPLIGMVAYFYTEFSPSRWIPRGLWGRATKSQEDLIRAAPIVLREFPHAKFLLIGSGWQEGGKAYLRRMQELVAQFGLQDSIIFTDFRTDIAPILRAIDVAVQPSLSENLGGTIESLLMECPTVATRVGGMTDSIVDGVTGVLVEPSNPASLAEGILRLLRDPATARSYGIVGRQKMLAGFTLRQTAADLSDLYRKTFDRQKVGYRPFVRGIRLIVGSFLCLLIVLRYSILDAWILRLWDQGWRPWRRNALSVVPRMWLYRFYAVLERNAPSLGLRRRISAFSRSLKYKLVYLKHLSVYQMYAVFGRNAPSLELRRRISAFPRSLKYKLVYLKHLYLYRLYAVFGRSLPAPGLRERIKRVAKSVWNRTVGPQSTGSKGTHP